MAIGEIFRLHTIWGDSAVGLTMENSFVFKQTSALIFDTPGEDLVQMYNAEIKPLHRECIHTNYHLESFRVTILPADLTVYEAAGNLDNAALTGDMLPRMTAGILSIRSIEPGRRGKGRLYLGPVNEASNSSAGQPVGAFVTAMNALGLGLIAVASDIAYAGWEYCVWSEADQEAKTVVTVLPRNYWGRQVGRAT